MAERSEEAESKPVEAPSLVGAEVITTAWKQKASFHNRRGKVVKVLAKKVRVELLSGPAKGQLHDYRVQDVRIIAPAVGTEGCTALRGLLSSPSAAKVTAGPQDKAEAGKEEAAKAVDYEQIAAKL
ncbi:MAG: hypothetical protein GY772_12835 [bacterium]|nr:hypothetical protein [bacterium]